MGATSIEWTDATWNPVGGCTIKSPACKPCYAQALAGTRLKNHPLYAGTTTPNKDGKPVFNGKLTAAPPNSPVWGFPLTWRGVKEPKLGAGMPSLIFVGDMSDLLHEDRSLGYFMRVLDAGHRSPHILQILTKRTDVLARAVGMWMDTKCENLGEFRSARGPETVRLMHKSGRGELFALMLDTMGEPPPGCAFPTFDWSGGPLRWPDVLPRVWLGFSAERQQEFDERWADMKPLAAAGWTIYVSYEPALGPLILPDDFLALGRRAQVIAGGMSGNDAKDRPTHHPNWFRDVRDQCYGAKVAFFFKQWGEWVPVDQVQPSAWSHVHDYFDDVYMTRAGRAKAGRLLDDAEHNDFPAVRL